MKNHYYFSALIEIVQFLALHQLPLRGNFDAFDDKDNVSSGLFMSLLDFSIKKDSKLAECVKTIPKNAHPISFGSRLLNAKKYVNPSAFKCRKRVHVRTLRYTGLAFNAEKVQITRKKEKARF